MSLIKNRLGLDLACIIIFGQEQWLGDGTVVIDGKVLAVEEVVDYRLGSSTRGRPRTRGGVLVRARVSWLMGLCSVGLRRSSSRDCAPCKAEP